MRNQNKGQYQAQEGISLTYDAFVAKATVDALKRYADFNATYSDDGHMRRQAINLGVAVAVDDGLVVPVIKDADRLSIHGLNRALRDLADRSRANKLTLDDIQGGTFTLDNTGWTGSIITQPIINAPQVGILTMESIVKRPVVVETGSGDLIGIKPMMYMTLGFDHRATDGAQAGRFVGGRQALARGSRLDNRDLVGRSESGEPAMRVVVTGGAGFIGRAVVARLAARGDDVVALVRDPARAAHLERDHVALVISDLSSVAQLTVQMKGADAVIHAAGVYEIGIKQVATHADVGRQRGRDGARPGRGFAAGVPRIVYVSTRHRLRQHPRRARRTRRTARPRGGLPVVVRRDQVPCPRGGHKRMAAGAPDSDRHALPGVRPARPLGRQRAARARLQRQAASHTR